MLKEPETTIDPTKLVHLESQYWPITGLEDLREFAIQQEIMNSESKSISDR